MCFIQLILLFNFLKAIPFIGKKLGEQDFWVFLTAQWFRKAKTLFKTFGCEEEKFMSREIEILMINHHLADLENQDLLESWEDMLSTVKLPVIIF